MAKKKPASRERERAAPKRAPAGTRRAGGAAGGGGGPLTVLPGAPITREGWGVLDVSGRVVVEPTLEAIGLFAEGLAPARRDGRWGYLDREGRFAIAPRFELAGAFACGRARVRLDGRWGFVDPSGELAIEPRFASVRDAEEGAVWVQEGALLGLIDLEGRPLTEVCFEEVFPWREGLAIVRREGRFGAIDAQGRVAVALEHEGLYDYCGGLAAAQLGERMGYLDRQGRVAIEPRFERGDDFSEGLARVQLEGRFGYIRPDGSLAIEASLGDGDHRRDDVGPQSLFREGRAVYGEAEDPDGYLRSFGYLAADGERLTPARFRRADPFAEGRARVWAGGAGYLAEDGSVAIPLELEEAGTFREGVAPARVEGRWGLIDRDGRWVLEPRYEEVSPAREGVVRVRLDGRYGLATIDGELRGAPTHELIGPSWGEGRLAFRASAPDEEATARELARVNRALAAALDGLAPTVQPFVRLRAEPHPEVDWSEDPAWWRRELEVLGPDAQRRSKLGGLPHVERLEDYPRDTDGEPLALLAQLDLGSLPALEGLPDRGLLQLFGPRSAHAAEGLALRYVAAPGRGVPPDEVGALLGALGRRLPVRTLATLTGERAEAPISIYDHRFAKAAPARVKRALSDERVGRGYEVLSQATGHKLGGYPCFVQDDPRGGRSRHKGHDVLLLQLDSDQHVQWEDAGTFHAFLPPDALEGFDLSQAFLDVDSC